VRRAGLALCFACTAASGAAAGGPAADVLAVQATGAPGAYELRVTVRSPDQDCSRYASFWEVVRGDGTLAYRRILNHSHRDEQPFTREGGPVPIAAEEVVVVRAFLHPPGYGGAALRGSVRGGFKPWESAPREFAAGLAAALPQPERCLY
jgi:hypothetical protein